jgi:hypothetical protein
MSGRFTSTGSQCPGLERKTASAQESHRSDADSVLTTESSCTVSHSTRGDTDALASDIHSRSKAKANHFGSNPSLTLGALTLTHEEQPRYVSVRTKYNSDSDANFLPSALIEEN